MEMSLKVVKLDVFSCATYEIQQCLLKWSLYHSLKI